MKDKLKGIIIGITIGSMLTGATAFAASGTIKVAFQKLGIYIDGTHKATAEAIIYNGKTYVPIRTVADSIGKQVGLVNHGLYIGKQPAAQVTEAKAIELVRKKYGISTSSPYYVEVDHMEGNSYVVHLYEVVIDDEKTGEGHTATYGWYYVDKYTGKITSMF